MLWIGRVFPVAYTAMLIIIIMGIHVVPFETVLDSFGSQIILLVFSTFILSSAFLKSGFAERLSLNVLRLSKGNIYLLLFYFFILMTLLAVIITVSIGRTGIIIGIIKTIENEFPIENIGKIFFIGLNYIVMITGALVITGSNTSIYVYGIFQSVSDYSWSYISWLILFGPPILIYVVLLWFIMIKLFPPEKIDGKRILENINLEIGKLGKLNSDEIKIIIIIIFTVTFWALESLHGLSIAMVGIIGAVLTMFPRIGIWKWTEAKSSVEWDLIIFIAANLSLANMLIETGALQRIASLIINKEILLQYPWLFLLIVVISTLLLRSIFAGVFGFVTVMIPLAFIIGEGVGEPSPMIFAMVVYLISLPGFFFIPQTSTNIMTYGLGYYSQRDLLKSGILASGLLIVIVVVTAIVYWNIII